MLKAWHSSILGAVFSFIPLLLLQIGLKLWRSVTSSRVAEGAEYPHIVDLGVWSRLSEVITRFMENSNAWEFVSGLVDSALLQLMDYLIIFGCAAAIALIIRRTQVDLRRWPGAFTQSVNTVVAPVSRYLSVGVVAYFITTAIYFLWRFFVHNIVNPIQDNVPIDIQTSIGNFAGYLPGIVLETIVVFPCVWFVLAFADRSTMRVGEGAIFALKFATFCAIGVFMQKLLRFDFPISTSLFDSIVAPLIGYWGFFMAYTIAYAVHAKKRKNNAIGGSQNKENPDIAGNASKAPSNTARQSGSNKVKRNPEPV